MIKSVILVAVLLLALCYSAFFLMWNAEAKADVYTANVGGLQLHIPAVPVGFLPIVGALIGAFVMAVAAWGPWAAQRKATKLAEARLEKAIEKFNEQKGRLIARNEDIARLEARIEELEGLEVEEPLEELETADEDALEVPEAPVEDAELEGV